MTYDKGIVLLSFGTTYEDTRKKNILALTALVQKEYPELLVMEAFSSNRVRKILRERDGMVIRSIEEAMEEMRRLGITELFICPTHILGGHEYEKCKRIANERRDWFQKLSFGTPLLGCEADYPKVAKAFWDGFSKAEDQVAATNEKSLRTAYVFMGHGTSHMADESYKLLESELRKLSGQEVYIATVEGAIEIEDVIRELGPSDGRQIYVSPFMLVAGDHAVNDMAGEEDSFASKLKDHGFEPVCVIKGIGEYPQIQKLYLEKIRKQMR